MSIRIDGQKCIGCGRCRQVCPGNLLYETANKITEIRYPKDCWGCTSCIKECEYNAIHYYLGADIGGRGSMLHTSQEKNLLHWIVTSPDNSRKVITIDKRQANAY